MSRSELSSTSRTFQQTRNTEPGIRRHGLRDWWYSTQIATSSQNKIETLTLPSPPLGDCVWLQRASSSKIIPFNFFLSDALYLMISGYKCIVVPLPQPARPSQTQSPTVKDFVVISLKLRFPLYLILFSSFLQTCWFEGHSPVNFLHPSFLLSVCIPE